MEIMGANLNVQKNINYSNKFNYLIQMLSAIEQIHNKGIVHQDIKPSNFVHSLNPLIDSRIYLIDFGLAKTHIADDGVVNNPIEAKNFIGTLMYASLNAHNKIVSILLFKLKINI